MARPLPNPGPSPNATGGYGAGGFARDDVAAQAGKGGGVHTYTLEERRSFSDFFNRELGNDPDLADRLPMNVNSDDLFKLVGDGVLLAKFINTIKPGTINEAKLCKRRGATVFQTNQNHIMVLDAARALGCTIQNIGPEDLRNGTPHLVLGVVWQLIRMALLNKVSVEAHPELLRLLDEGETVQHLAYMAPEENLLRWVNWHLKRAGTQRRLKNFGNDVKDSECYLLLLNQLEPSQCSTEALGSTDLLQRARGVLQNAEKLGCARFVTPEDIVSGNSKLNMAFVAYLFNQHPGLDRAEADDSADRARRQQELDEVLRMKAQAELEVRQALELAEKARADAEARARSLDSEEEARRRKWQEEEEQRKRHWEEEEARRRAAWERDEAERQRRLREEEEGRARHFAEEEARRAKFVEEQRMQLQMQAQMQESQLRERQEQARREELERQAKLAAEAEEARRRAAEEAERLRREREEAERRRLEEEERRRRAAEEEEKRRRQQQEYEAYMLQQQQAQAAEQAAYAAQQAAYAQQQQWEAQQAAYAQQQQQEWAAQQAAAAQAAQYAAYANQYQQQQTVTTTYQYQPQAPAYYPPQGTVFPIGRLLVSCMEGRNLVKKGMGGMLKSDPYCILETKGQRFQTIYQSNTQFPVWGETFEFHHVQATDELTITVWDYDKVTKHDFMGQIILRSGDFVTGQKWFTLSARPGQRDRVAGELLVKIVVGY